MGRRLVGSFVAAALCTVALALAPADMTAAPAARPTGPPVPLNSSFEQAGDSWLVVPMGHLSSFLNTFWQLFVRSPTGSGWVTVTPPGVADNGGLAVTGGGDGVLAGFLPSQDLTFSPLGSSTDAGQSWQGAYFPEALSADPDALSAGTDGAVLALGRANGATVLGKRAGSSSWRTLTTLKKLGHTRAGGLCGIARLTAVAVAPDGDELVGAACLRDGGSAVFALSGDTARPIVAAIGGADVSVLRLMATPNGVSGLFAAQSAGGTELRAGWLATGARSFALSAPLALGSGTLVATGATGLGGVFVLVGRPHAERELAEVDPGSPAPSWDVLPPPPRGTVGAAFANGRTDAVTVHNSILIDYTLDPGHDTWVRSQRLQVPIQYGSSS
jgi:hypothetical protein